MLGFAIGIGDLHIRFYKQILYFAIDSDIDPESRFAAQAKAKPSRCGRLLMLRIKNSYSCQKRIRYLHLQLANGRFVD